MTNGPASLTKRGSSATKHRERETDLTQGLVVSMKINGERTSGKRDRESEYLMNCHTQLESTRAGQSLDRLKSISTSGPV